MLQTFHYLRGNKVSFDLKKELSDLGFKIKETIIYKQKNNKLSDKQKINHEWRNWRNYFLLSICCKIFLQRYQNNS